LPHYDAYSNVFFVPGPRTTGTGAHTFLLTGPFWNGEVPEGMTQVKAPTNTVWMIGRTQVNSAEDGATVVAAIQNGMKIDVLSKYGHEYGAPLGKVSEDYKKIVPVDDTRALTVEEYFNKLAQLMADNPPAEADAPLIKDMVSIGIVAGQKFSTKGMSPELIEKLNAIPEQAHQNWIDKSTGKKDAGVPNINNWIFARDVMGFYGTNYEHRAFIAFIGLGANLAEDAVYPSTSKDSEGNTIEGEYKYVIHFEKGQTPPANAFWSLTAYNSKDFLVANSINRFALGDRDDLKYNKDGSLDIYIQKTDPGRDKTSNWLPSTQEGLTNLTLRLYWPKESALDGTWIVPAVKKIE
jgi:DNA sulfur modification protein DndE